MSTVRVFRPAYTYSVPLIIAVLLCLAVAAPVFLAAWQSDRSFWTLLQEGNALPLIVIYAVGTVLWEFFSWNAVALYPHGIEIRRAWAAALTKKGKFVAFENVKYIDEGPSYITIGRVVRFHMNDGKVISFNRAGIPDVDELISLVREAVRNPGS